MLYLLNISHLRKKYDNLRCNEPTFLLSNATAFNHTPLTDRGRLPVELNSSG